MPKTENLPLELWGGVECTLNRVGDTYFDQMEQSGHAARADDLELFAGLGLRHLRYPLLWERIAPEGLARADWSWPDERLARMQALGITPIAGLLHHGSGPRETGPLDPQFPEKFAAFAGAAAARYPWLTLYTPVNEPLTTARFSGLYGHWYPHGRDEPTFARILINQCRAVILAMEAIRAVNPQARLLQTEDLAKTWSTPALAYQAEFENERRWLSLDLLCGHVVRGHRMHGHLRWAGISDRELDWFQAHACPPDLVGADYYPTSERFLDERCDSYPPWTWGGNGRHRYADIEAVRVRQEGIAGLSALLLELWERYQLPIAVTEAHLGCTVDEQRRWLAGVWEDALAARQQGVDVRSVTAWALLGCFNWESLVTRDTGSYEPGVFDIRSGRPEPTPLAELVAQIARGLPLDPLLQSQPGWWQHSRRLLYAPISTLTPPAPHRQRSRVGAGKRMLAG